MILYYFDFDLGAERSIDSEGLMFANDEDAKRNGLRALGEVLKESMGNGSLAGTELHIRTSDRAVAQYRVCIELESLSQTY